MSYKSLLILLLLFFSTSALAHRSALSYLELKEHSDLAIEMTLKKPSQDIGSDDLRLDLPKRCVDTLPPATYQDERFIISKRHLWCKDRGIEGSGIWVNDLLESDKGVIFRYESSDGKKLDRLLTASDPYVLIEVTDEQGSSSAYLWLGVEHILLGIDHLLFVLALLLLVPNTRVLIQTVTAFTVAHSITLGLVVLGSMKFSVPYTETLIALSIVFLARELLLDRAQSSLTYRYPWLVAFVFGLLHGLGFASALSDVGLPSDNIAFALLFFNLGVELGQLLFVLTILSIIKIAQRSVAGYQSVIRTSSIYVIGVTATYWTIERGLTLF